MIKSENVFINGKEFIKTYSSKKMLIKDDNGILYTIAYDLVECPRTYFESDIKIK